jgi:hypothetical protein
VSTRWCGLHCSRCWQYFLAVMTACRGSDMSKSPGRPQQWALMGAAGYELDLSQWQLAGRPMTLALAWPEPPHEGCTQRQPLPALSGADCRPVLLQPRFFLCGNRPASQHSCHHCCRAAAGAQTMAAAALLRSTCRCRGRRIVVACTIANVFNTLSFAPIQEIPEAGRDQPYFRYNESHQRRLGALEVVSNSFLSADVDAAVYSCMCAKFTVRHVPTRA